MKGRRGACAAALIGSALAVGCGQDAKPSATSAASSGAPPAAGSASAAASSQAAPGAVAICDVVTPEEHTCFEFHDEEIASERARVCAAGLVRGGACPAKDRLGACRLPDGSVRYGYPPRTQQQSERACKDARGIHANGSTAPPPDPRVLLSCRGKHKGACEEETTFTAGRAAQIRDDCSTFGGLLSEGEACSRDRAVATCDLEGKRFIVFYPDEQLEEPDERRKFCEERNGKYAELAPSAASSASASAGPSPN